MHNDGMSKDAPTIAYWPTLLSHFESDQVSVRRFVVFAIRTSRAGSENLMKDVRQPVWSVDANLPLTGIHTQDYSYRKSIWRTSFTPGDAWHRRRYRLATRDRGALRGDCVLGIAADPRDRHSHCARSATHVHCCLVCGQGLVLAGSGMVCGLPLAFLATGLLKSLLFHVNPVDPATYVLACVALCAAAALASYIPSRRTAAANPVEALRAE